MRYAAELPPARFGTLLERQVTAFEAARESGETRTELIERVDVLCRLADLDNAFDGSALLQRAVVVSKKAGLSASTQKLEERLGHVGSTTGKGGQPRDLEPVVKALEKAARTSPEKKKELGPLRLKLGEQRVARAQAALEAKNLGLANSLALKACEVLKGNPDGRSAMAQAYDILAERAQYFDDDCVQALPFAARALELDPTGDRAGKLCLFKAMTRKTVLDADFPAPIKTDSPATYLYVCEAFHPWGVKSISPKSRLMIDMSADCSHSPTGSWLRFYGKTGPEIQQYLPVDLHLPVDVATGTVVEKHWANPKETESTRITIDLPMDRDAKVVFHEIQWAPNDPNKALKVAADIIADDGGNVFYTVIRFNSSYL